MQYVHTGEINYIWVMNLHTLMFHELSHLVITWYKSNSGNSTVHIIYNAQLHIFCFRLKLQKKYKSLIDLIIWLVREYGIDEKIIKKCRWIDKENIKTGSTRWILWSGQRVKHACENRTIVIWMLVLIPWPKTLERKQCCQQLLLWR